jgi:hypothetical protein
VSTDIDGTPRRIESHIETLRHELGELVSELDRRRHEAFDFRLQMRKHPTAVAVAGVALAALVGIGLAVAIHGRRERARPVNRARRARAAVERLVRDPEHMAREPGVGEKILAAAGTAAASLLVKRAFERYVPARP